MALVQNDICFQRFHSVWCKVQDMVVIFGLAFGCAKMAGSCSVFMQDEQLRVHLRLCELAWACSAPKSRRIECCL